MERERPTCANIFCQPELARLDFMHDIFLQLLGNRFFLAPVDLTKMTQALDMGTGTGICIHLCCKLHNV